jgi:hypothetical protein
MAIGTKEVLDGECLLLAQSGQSDRSPKCPLSAKSGHRVGGIYSHGNLPQLAVAR